MLTNFNNIFKNSNSIHSFICLCLLCQVRWITVACQNLCAISRENKDLWCGGDPPLESTDSPNCIWIETSGRIWGSTCPQCLQECPEMLCLQMGPKQRCFDCYYGILKSVARKTVSLNILLWKKTPPLQLLLNDDIHNECRWVQSYQKHFTISQEWTGITPVTNETHFIWRLHQSLHYPSKFVHCRCLELIPGTLSLSWSCLTLLTQTIMYTHGNLE